MAQFRWSYLSPRGKRYIVGLFHGSRTGHLMVYVNSKVVQIDFKVYDTATYSFFIEEDLCEINIKKREGRFFYDFKINKEVDTPINRKRKQFDKTNRRLIIVFFVGIAVFITAAVSFGNAQKKKRAREEAQSLQLLLEKMTKESVAIIDSVSKSGDKGTIFYNYSTSTQLKTGQYEYNVETLTEYTQGLPLRKGDEFLIKYISSLDSSRLELDRPTELQILNYINRAIGVETRFHSDLSLYEIRCRVECAYRVKGLKGLADVYFQNISIIDNLQHNELSYKRLVRDIPFQKAFEQFCLSGG